MEGSDKSRMDEILEQLEAGVASIFEGEGYKRYLDTMSRFHNYSVNNCILIAMQRPDATYVAGYTAWNNTFHRKVRKGEKGITIIAPCTYKKRVEVKMVDERGFQITDATGRPMTEQKEVIYQGYRTATVFDVSQTEGEPLPKLTEDLQEPVKNFDEYFYAIKDLSLVPVRFDNITSGAKGYYSSKRQEIVLQRGMSEEQTLKTLIHECAHARLGHGGKNDHLDRRTHEVQAESIAYCCCKAIGLDTGEYSFGYIAGWSSGKDHKELKSSLQTIRDQADSMINGACPQRPRKTVCSLQTSLKRMLCRHHRRIPYYLTGRLTEQCL